MLAIPASACTRCVRRVPPNADSSQLMGVRGCSLCRSSAEGRRVFSSPLLQGKSRKYYRATVKAVHKLPDGSAAYDVQYDDGDRESGVLPAHMRRIMGDQRAVTPAAPIPPTDPNVLAAGERCECRFRVS
jgi:hypothetical protein